MKDLCFLDRIRGMKRVDFMRFKKLVSFVSSMMLVLSPMHIYAQDSVYAIDDNGVSYTTIESAWSAACSGTQIYLSSDWDLDSKLEVASNENVTIDLNGHKLDRQLTDYESDGQVISIGENASLTLNGSVERTFTLQDTDLTIGGIVTGGMSNNSGGGIQLSQGSVLNLNHVGIVGNSAGGVSPNGGGIQITGSNCVLNMKNGSIISYNDSKSLGGGIYVGGDNASISMSNSSISNNTANNGGGIYSYYAGTNIILNENSTIDKNLASYSGGGIYFKASNSSLNSDDKTGKICENAAGVENSNHNSYGGGLYYDLSSEENNTASIQNISFENNVVKDGNGGAIYSGINRLQISNSTFTSNSSAQGGAIFIDANKNIVSDCTISNNTATDNGGAIYVNDEYSLGIEGQCTIKDNQEYDIYLSKNSYVSGTPDEGSSVGLYGSENGKIAMNQTKNNDTYFLDNADGYSLEYHDGQLYQEINSNTGSVFGNGNTYVIGFVILCICAVAAFAYEIQKNKKTNS